MIASSRPNIVELSVDDFDYPLPPHLVAQTPVTPRDAGRLMVLGRFTGGIRHSRVRDLGSWLNPGDLLVANNSRVIPARLAARKAETGGRVEILLLRQREDGCWLALAKPSRRLRPGASLVVPPRVGGGLPDVELSVVDAASDGQLVIAFVPPVPTRLADYGGVPLPPYITAPLGDPERYQTVYGSSAGSAAAPTAGLHFTPDLIEDLRRSGIGWAEVTLHVGLDTFRPMSVDRVRDHRIHREWCSVPEETARRVALTRQRGGRVVAVGTTAARTLETLGADWHAATPTGLTTMTELFVLPGYRWRVVDALLTNFHLPRSTLLMMVSAFAGRQPVLRAYAAAVAAGYRFFSFGDAMLIR